jgi:hypothetical protein
VIEPINLSRDASETLLSYFNVLEKAYLTTDWAGSEDGDKYIWLIDNSVLPEKPIGFIAYKEYSLHNMEEFIFIVKIYVLKGFSRVPNPHLIENKKASNILLERLEALGKPIITLESACGKLDKHYEDFFGFKYNVEIANQFSKIIGIKGEHIMYKKINAPKLDISKDEQNRLFGKQITSV